MNRVFIKVLFYLKFGVFIYLQKKHVGYQDYRKIRLYPFDLIILEHIIQVISGTHVSLTGLHHTVQVIQKNRAVNLRQHYVAMNSSYYSEHKGR